jgi:hypothetical protein
MRITQQASLAFTVAVAGLLALGAVPASAQGATVASASGAMIPNPNFAANSTDTVNPAIGAEASVHLVVGADGRTIASGPLVRRASTPRSVLEFIRRSPLPSAGDTCRVRRS